MGPEIRFITVSNIGTAISDRLPAPEVPVRLPACGTRYTPGVKIVRLWIPVCLAGLVVVGCGQKGPLGLLDTPKHQKAAPSPRAPPAPAPTAPAPTAPAPPAPIPPASG